MNDLKGWVESWVAASLLIDLFVKTLADLLGDGIAINLLCNHIRCRGDKRAVGEGDVVVIIERDRTRGVAGREQGS